MCLAQTGNVAPKAHGGGKARCINADGERIIRELVTEDNDATLMELHDRFAERVKAVSLATIGRVVLRLGLTLKKRPSMRPSATRIESSKHAKSSRRYILSGSSSG
ncbi:MAG TPA: hypothetical protein VGY54_05020 [Polyangiaceae bacterium]|jgi:transposase|nr:hypothetical protein [Polyangiaceae bacterium]